MQLISMESKRGCTISISGLLLSLILYSWSPAYGNPDCVRWEDLAEHLSAKSIPLVLLNLCDSPDNMPDAEPDRVVSQVIENTYYLWEEYDIALDPDIYMCIVMKKPNPGPLSAQEAQVLLTGSMLWKVSIPNPADFSLYSLNEPHTEREDGAPYKLQSVIGADSRARITSDRTDDFPWNTYCALESISDIGDGWISLGYGTGCLVGPYTVLTCAHNIYSHDRASFIDTMTVIPGQTQNSKGGPTTKAYGSQEIVDYEIAPEFINSDGAEYEYAAIFLDKPFSGINTYMPLEFSSYVSEGDTISIAGYPGEVRLGTSEEDKDSHALWDANGVISRIDPDSLYYETDTSAGDSGAPLRNRNSSVDPYRIIGIHSKGAGSYNRGARLGAHNQELIDKWMQWRPPTEYHSTDAPKAIPDGGAIFSELDTLLFGSIADLKVKLDITHTRVADLDVYLHYDSQIFILGQPSTSWTIELFTDVGGSGDNFRNTILDFDAPLSIKDGRAPFNGSYRPESPLAFPLNHGTWRLEVRDDTGGYAGTLNSWSLIVQDSVPPTVISADNYSESFESGLGEWINVFGSDDIDWTRERAGTRSTDTGPTSAHGGNYYLYAESSGPSRGYPDKTAILESPYLEIPVPPASPLDHWMDPRWMYELQFSYHMRGDEMGTLSVEILGDNGFLLEGGGTVRNWTQVWSRSGAQGSGWQDGKVSLSNYHGEEIKVRFKAVTGTGYTSDIAIDDVSINLGWGLPY